MSLRTVYCLTWVSLLSKYLWRIFIKTCKFCTTSQKLHQVKVSQKYLPVKMITPQTFFIEAILYFTRKKSSSINFIQHSLRIKPFIFHGYRHNPVNHCRELIHHFCHFIILSFCHNVLHNDFSVNYDQHCTEIQWIHSFPH